MSGMASGAGDGEGPADGESRAGHGRPARGSDGGRSRLSPGFAVAMAISLGLGAGYLDVLLIVLRRFFLNPEGYYRIARDFPWSVPVGHAALMVIPGVVVAAMWRLAPRIAGLHSGTWALATLAAWGALLRLPIYGWCSLLLAGGLGRLVADAVAADGPGRERLRRVPVALLAVLGVLAALSSGWRALREYRSVDTLAAAPSHARNVVLIVWDTVRQDHTSLHPYGRDTTPNLARWAREGVVYRSALAPAPWTFPSHSCFLTGQWPMRLDTQWRPRLDAADPTLAEYLASRGYQTAAFVANTNSCSYECGIDRGFARFDDYSATPGSILARTVPGRWLLEQALDRLGNHHARKWVSIQSRDAGDINRTFLDWLGRRRADRPFFAFLNYFDAHDTYIPPPRFEGRFGIRPRTPRDYRVLVDLLALDKSAVSVRDITMARDCYDSCIAYLDDQLGRLLDELRRRGLLADTEVIITSDHGEAFGEHGRLGHSYTVYLEEIRVPLVILSPVAPAGSEVFHPVSLRDLPATVADRLGLASDSPFPGRSLAAYWGLSPGRMPPPTTSAALSEQVGPTARLLLRPEAGPGGLRPGFRMSLVAWNHHYVRDGSDREQLFDLSKDPFELVNLAAAAEGRPVIEAFRARLLDVLAEDPGSTEVERAYLGSYRQRLDALVRGGSAGPVAGDLRSGPDRQAPSRQPAS